jgi:hypothetical protein
MLQGYPKKKTVTRTGRIKLHAKLKQDIKIGRNQFYSFLRLHNLFAPKLENYVKTTNSKHQFKKYKNLIKDKVANRPKQH